LAAIDTPILALEGAGRGDFRVIDQKGADRRLRDIGPASPSRTAHESSLARRLRWMSDPMTLLAHSNDLQPARLEDHADYVSA